MKRTIAAAIVAAIATFALVTAQTATQTQQQTKTNTNTNTSTTNTTSLAAPVDPMEPMVEPTVEPWVDPINPVEEEAAATPRTGEKEAKVVATSCPIHPEVKTRAAGKCPVCRMEERKQAAVLAKDQSPLTQPEVTPAQPTQSPTPQVLPTQEPVTSDTTSTQPIP